MMKISGSFSFIAYAVSPIPEGEDLLVEMRPPIDGSGSRE
jgi:hypothetical protein